MNQRLSMSIGRGLVCALAAALCLAVCTEVRPASAAASSAASPAASTSSGQPVVLRIGWNMKVDNLNPFIGIESTSYALYHLNYDYLTQTDPKTLEPAPSLAASWTSSDDLKKWTFKLRDDVKFQDGEPLTAADVVYSIELNQTDEIGNYDAYVSGIDSCKAIDDHTVEFSCSEPLPRILTNLTLVPIVPRHIWSKMSIGEISRKFQNQPPVIGSGPFQIVEFEQDKFVRLKANPGFWGEQPKVDEIIFQMYTNNDTLTSDLKAGLIQAGNVGAAAYRTLKDAPGLETSLSHENGFDELGFNCYDSPDSLGNPILLDPAFRWALAWAIDRDKIASIAWDGFAEPATTVIPADFYDPGLDYHWEPSAEVAYSYDPEKCKELLDAAGYEDTDGDGIREDKRGKPIELRLWAASAKPEYASAAKFITGGLEDVGLKISMQVMDDGALTDRQFNYVGDKFAPDFDLFIWGWETGEYDPNFLLSLFTTAQIESWSDSNFSDAEYDAMYKTQDYDANVTSRLATVHEMQQLLYEAAPYVPLVYPLTREVHSSAWQGWVRMPEANGSIWNRNTYIQVHPNVASTAVAGDSSSTGLIVTIVAVVAIVAIALVVLVRRRSHRAEVEAA
jgi:peptide/nickel transport system substrate-binding protein